MSENEPDLRHEYNLERLALPLTPGNLLTAFLESRIAISRPTIGVMQDGNRVAVPHLLSEPTILEVSPDRLDRPLPSTGALVVTFLTKQERG